MNIVVGSAFRNSVHHVERWVTQVAALARHAGPDHRVRALAVEGDSTDRTRERLVQAARDRGLALELETCAHGGPVYGSTEQPERMSALSQVGNAILDGIWFDDDVLVYVESDLLWSPHTIGSLVDAALARTGGFDVFAPLVFAGPHFYDVWAFRKDGERFGPFPPYHRGLRGLTEVDSAGSCLVMRAEVSAKVRMTDGALVEWCANARAQGYRIAVWPDFRVEHP